MARRRLWRRLKRWGEEGAWERIWRAALSGLDQQGRLDWSMSLLDGSFAPAKRGDVKVGVTKKGKGTKWMLEVDGNGLPLGFHLDSANTAEVKLAEQTLDTIRVARPRGRPQWRPQKLVADRGYYSSAFRQALRRLSAALYGGRSFAWLGNFRRLLIRWERLFGVYRSLFTVAVLIVCLRRLTCAGETAGNTARNTARNTAAGHVGV
jgi:hypothetical protein